MLFDWMTPQMLVLTAGGCFVLGYLAINQAVLRGFLLLGSLFYLAYYFTAAPSPLWDAIYMSVLMMLANVIGLISLMMRRLHWIIPRAHRDLYQRFKALPPGDFRDLVVRAHRETLAAPRQITTEGQPVDRLWYVISGGLEIEKRGQRFRMPAGVFIGEVAYMTGMASSASTWLPAGAEVLVWDFADLRQKARRGARFKLALEAMISRDLATKVAFAVAPMDRDAAEQEAQKYLA